MAIFKIVSYNDTKTVAIIEAKSEDEARDKFDNFDYDEEVESAEEYLSRDIESIEQINWGTAENFYKTLNN